MRHTILPMVGKKGSVHIDIPKCISSGTLEMTEENYQKINSIYPDIVTSISEKDIFVNNIENDHTYICTGFNKTVELINDSKKPIIYRTRLQG